MRRRRRRSEPIIVKPRRPDPFLEQETRKLERLRKSCLRRYDDLAPQIRAALRDCPFDVHVLIRGNLNVDKVVGRIKAIRSLPDAHRFNQDFC